MWLRHNNGNIMKYWHEYKRDMRWQKKEGDHKNCVHIVANNDIIIACGENVINLICDESSRFVDFGATSHVKSKNEFFSFYTLGNFGILKMGNNDEVEVFGIGTVSLEYNNCSRLILNNVRHAPNTYLIWFL